MMDGTQSLKKQEEHTLEFDTLIFLCLMPTEMPISLETSEKSWKQTNLEL
jgi:hypothetical protein